MIKNSFTKVFNFDDEFYDKIGQLSLQRTGSEINNFIRNVMISYSQDKKVDCFKILKNH